MVYLDRIVFFILVHLLGNCFSNMMIPQEKNASVVYVLKTPGIFNQGRQITKIEIDFESESRECVKLGKNEGKLKSI